ncbi:MAG: DUF2865 domain-containing protein [Pseudomonadota bacterium]
MNSRAQYGKTGAKGRMLGSALGIAVLASVGTVAHVTPSDAQNRCFALEQQLQRLGRAGGNRQAAASRARGQLRGVERKYRQARSRLDRANCYTNFFFAQTLKNTRQCVRLDRQVRRLEAQRSRLRATINNVRQPTNTAARRAQIVRALARNNCGAIYQREARRTQRNRGWNPFESVFGRESGVGGGFFDNAPRELPPEDGIRVGSTYRTMCVRQCDGYYYPVSFSTLPSKFPTDASQCRSSCAAPAELYIYRNPGAEVEQMVSLDGDAYTALPNAFRYREEFIKGCSCRSAEYDPLAGTKQAAVETAPVDDVERKPASPLPGTSTDDAGEGASQQPAPPRVNDGTQTDESAAAQPAPPRPGDVAQAGEEPVGEATQ